MKVLVTGGAGSIGSHLVETLLWRGDDVVVLDDLSGGSRENLSYVEGFQGLEIVEGTTLDENLVNELAASADAIVHLAGSGPSGGMTGLRSNIQGTINILAAGADKGCKTVLVPSREWTAAAGSRTDEKLAIRMAHKWGFPVSVARAHNVVGPRDRDENKGLLARFVDAAMKGRDLVIPGDGSELFSFSYVDDVVAGILLALRSVHSGGNVYTFASDEMITSLELAHLVIQATESDSQIVFGARVADPNTETNVPEVKGARKGLGFEAEWSVRDGISALVAAKLGRPIPEPVGRTERRRPAVIDLRDVAMPAVVETPHRKVETGSLETSPFRRRVDDPVSAGVAPPTVSVVMPVYNEQNLIAEAVRRVRAQACVSELIVVDDGSNDGTRAELEKVRDLIDHLVLLPRNRGKGAALREGVRYVTGTYMVFQDSDLELDAADIERLALPLIRGDADVVCGTRIHASNRKVVSTAQWIANRAVTRLASFLYRLDSTDMATAARAMSKATWDRLEVESDRFGVEAELYAKTARAGARILEIPIVFRPRTKLEGKKIRWTDGIVAGQALFRYRMWKPAAVGVSKPVAAPPPMSTYASERTDSGEKVTPLRPFQPVRWEPASVGVAPSAATSG